jgi:hypothetical protein
MAKGMGLAFIEGTLGRIVLPLANLTKVTQWIYQSRIAYATAVAYGRKPKNDKDFKRDLIFLMGDDKAIADAAKKYSKTPFSGIITLDVVMDMANDKATDMVFDALKVNSSIQWGANTTLAIVGGTNAANTNLSANQAFLNRCIDYYKPKPPAKKEEPKPGSKPAKKTPAKK